MAYIVMTSTANTIKCDNGVYSGVVGPLGTVQKKATFRKDDVFRIALMPDESYVEIQFKSRTNLYFLLTHDGATGSMKVDSIDGVAPTDNADLFTKLEALIA